MAKPVKPPLIFSRAIRVRNLLFISGRLLNGADGLLNPGAASLPLGACVEIEMAVQC